MYLNKVLLYGNLTRDPEAKNTEGGTLVASMGLATNRSFTKDGQKKEQTEFHNIVAFGKTAEVMAQYLKKGRPVFIEGRLQTRSWDDKETNKKQYKTEIVVDSFQFGPQVGGEPRVEEQREELEKEFKEPVKVPGNPEYPVEEIDPEDIPF